MLVEILPATKRHAVAVGCELRPADALEVRALGLGAIEATFTSWRASHFATALKVDGEVAAVGGLIVEPHSALEPRVGHAWLLTSKHVERAPMALHRLAKAWLREAAQHVDVVWNRVDARYEASLRWLRALGFTVVEPATPEASGVLFHTVFRRF